MSSGLGLTFIFLFISVVFANALATAFDYYGKVKNKKTIQLRGLTKFLFFKDKKHFPNKKVYVSELSFGYQIINYIYVVGTLAVAILCELFCPNSIIALTNILIIIGYGVFTLIGSMIFSTIAAMANDKFEKQNKKEIESQSTDDNITT